MMVNFPKITSVLNKTVSGKGGEGRIQNSEKENSEWGTPETVLFKTDVILGKLTIMRLAKAHCRLGRKYSQFHCSLMADLEQIHRHRDLPADGMGYPTLSECAIALTSVQLEFKLLQILRWRELHLPLAEGLQVFSLTFPPSATF